MEESPGGHAKLLDILQLLDEYNTRERRDRPWTDVKPGFLLSQLPPLPPQHPEPWADIVDDLKKYYMDVGIRQDSPYFLGYVPTPGSEPARLAAIIEERFNDISAIWTGSPAAVELEMGMMDWMARSFGLPDHFLHDVNSAGGGAIVTSSSEGELLSMCAARNKKIHEVLATNPSLSPHHIFHRLVVYSSQEAHPNATRACQLLMLRQHVVPVQKGHDLAMTGSGLQRAMDEDRQRGLIPFFVVATLGTTSTCAFDNLKEIGDVCVTSECWLHVDAAYAGVAFLCPEFRHYLEGVEHVDSFCVNFYKWMRVNLGRCGFWLKNASYLTEEFSTTTNTAKYLSDAQGGPMPSLVKWQLHTCKPCHALQVWFVVRTYGISGLQQQVRTTVEMAQYAASLLRQDGRIVITHPVSMGMVCFKLKDEDDEGNKEYLARIQRDERIVLIGCSGADGFFLRLCINNEHVARKHMERTVQILTQIADTMHPPTDIIHV